MIRAGSLTLVPAGLATVGGGPNGCLARAALDGDVSVADLAFGDEEPDEDEIDDAEAAEDEVAETEMPGDDRAVEVRFIANETSSARRAIRRWAARAGHRWIWFRDELVGLDPPPEVDGEFATTCPTCGLEITDSGPGLMKFVHAVGHFPLNCFVCGAFVPQWEPVLRGPGSEARRAQRRRRVERLRQLRVVDSEPRA